MPRIIPEEEVSGFTGGPTGNAVQTTFVYRPGGIAADNVYTTWASLVADVALVEGPKIVQIDDSIVTPAPIPAGSYDFSDVTIVGDPEIRGVPPVMILSDGAVFTALEEIQHIELVGDSTTPSFSATTSKQIILRDSIVRVTGGSSEIFTASATFDLILDRTEFIGSEPIVDVTAGTTTIWLENQSSILADLIDSGGATIVDFNCVDANVSVAGQSGVTGATTTTALSEADKVFYDSTTSGIAADNVQDAIDIIAVG
ncbi:MAG: hypothetical protein ACXABY_18780, partial [Candidatus Thorarchaeota archaeon]